MDLVGELRMWSKKTFKWVELNSKGEPQWKFADDIKKVLGVVEYAKINGKRMALYMLSK